MCFKLCRRIGAPAVLTASLLFLVSCAATDTVATYAKKSFAAFAGAVSVESGASGGWTILSPGGDRFFFPAPQSSDRRFRLEFDAAPFLAAGLDSALLPSFPDASYRLDGGTLVLAFPAGKGSSKSAAAGLAEAFDAFVAADRGRIGYHHEMDHYGIVLGAGNVFEWAGDMAKNDKDLVFVLNPEPFAAAGVNLDAVEGWVHAQVPVREGGKMVQVWKLLRPYELR